MQKIFTLIFSYMFFCTPTLAVNSSEKSIFLPDILGPIILIIGTAIITKIMNDKFNLY